jgi:hypothetical protein
MDLDDHAEDVNSIGTVYEEMVIGWLTVWPDLDGKMPH